MQDLDILRMAGALARHSSARHQIVSENLANSDTPGYQARDLESFTTHLRGRLEMAASRSAHLSASGRVGFDEMLDTAPGATSPNGNDVSIDDQMARAAAALHDHGKAMAVYGKTLDILRAGLGRG